MLIHDDGTTWTAIGQPAHAWLAAQLARSWRVPLPDDVLLAIEQHDVAWTELDRAPTLHVPERRAASFVELPAPVRHAAWDRVAGRLVAQSPYAALLVSLHATNIHTRYGSPEHRPVEFLERQRADQELLLSQLAGVGVTRASAESDADVLFCLDALSLALCARRAEAAIPGPVGGTVHLAAAEGDVVTLDPWPFAGERVTCWLHARRFERRFEDEEALRRAFSTARWHRLEWTLQRRDQSPREDGESVR